MKEATIVGAFALVSLPFITSRRPAAPLIAKDVVAAYPGTRNVELDSSGAALVFELHFPGNLSGLVRRLRDSNIAVGERAQVSVPVASLVPELLESQAEVDERLQHGAEVWDAQFTRGSYVLEARLAAGRVEASILPSSSAMHQMYDSMLSLGLVASETAPPLGETV